MINSEECVPNRMRFFVCKVEKDGLTGMAIPFFLRNLSMFAQEGVGTSLSEEVDSGRNSFHISIQV